MKRREMAFISGRTACVGAGRVWTQRLVDSYGLILVLAGKCIISSENNCYLADRASLILMRPGVRHGFQVEVGTDLLWFHFLPRPHLMSMLDWPEQIRGLSGVKLEQEEYLRARTELEEAQQLETLLLYNWYALAVTLLEASVIRGFNHVTVRNSDHMLPIQSAQKMLLNDKVEIDDIAAKCGLSRASFYSKFKALTGVSPRQYRESAYMRHAMRLLEGSSLSVAQIADEIGISDPFYFSTRFRKYSGMSPRQYRHRAVFSGKQTES